MNRRLSLTLVALATFALAACSNDATAPTIEDSFVSSEVSSLDKRPGDQTIAEVADAQGFTLLLAAVDYIATTNPESGLVAGLLNNDQYTVFAPTDVAFEALVTAVSGLLDPDTLAQDGPFAAIDEFLGAGTIEAVVSYHVTEGRRIAKSVVPRKNDRKVQTLLDGASFTVSPAGEIRAVGSMATIEAADVSASNGIIHVVDTVLLPVDLGL